MKEYNTNYRLKRKTIPTYIGVNVSSLVLGNTHNISFEHKERLWGLRDKGFVLLPNHQKWIDIPLEGILLKRKLNREGNYIMKGSLPKWVFEPMGGISIIRDKEVKILAEKYGRREAIRAAREREEEIYTHEIPNLLARDEIVVTHIEGTRMEMDEVKIGKANVKNIMKSQKAYGEQITFVPLDIKYEGKDVTMKVGNPIEVPDEGIEELLEHLRNEVERWY
ncbi:MAG: 1-acyl-sn-glycerol-3-phosphate acyltransferase [Candidatus Woesearchaeota archaeon]|jgi:hypothetical protein|nr:1-acyl-sn-glycerol-3-phosphate acyltransferase [Candidatus Woesearchaeota archaeon]MDP7506744.1 1-acyl-sn-glycerol-3-phosphate acyltransferase [Candidatus Woesearchaeota archaeon]|tara:strand:- start:21377 stop:22042 length:666 start_codon:yes stop_codon:yes gene_type:complete